MKNIPLNSHLLTYNDFVFRSNSTGLFSRTFIDGHYSTAARKFKNNEIVQVTKWTSKTIPWFFAMIKIIY